MNLFSKGNLIYKDYKWTTFPSGDPRIKGRPDETAFNRSEGNEVVYLINKLMSLWDYRFVNTGTKMEKLIHDRLPAELTSQEQVQNWIKDNLKF